MKKLRIHIQIFVVVLFFILFYYIFSIGCPIRAILHIPCPTCGMTRSILALAHLDLKLSLYFNPITVPFLVLLLFAIHKDLFKLEKKIINSILISCSLLIFIIYIFRLYTNSIP